MPDSLDPPAGPDDHARGRPDAPYVLTMYADFECPFCQAAQGILARVEKRLDDDLLLVSRHFPVDGRHPLARDAARVAEAAAAQGAYWPMHDALFALRGDLTRPKLMKAVRGLGLDVKAAERALDERVHDARIAGDLASGERSGVTGTPAFFAGGTQIQGAFDASSIVEALRAGA